jgi:PIN domain nuclease of toxin-antitoxin system
MNEAVLDASAILAVLFQEPGAEKLTDEILQNAVVSTVNLAEVHSKLVKMGHGPNDAWVDAHSLGATAEMYTSKHARIAGDLITSTKKYGFSLGDRSCLALAICLNAEVYTTEQSWRNLNVGVPIHVIR